MSIRLELIEDSNDWEWYKSRLDATAKHHHRHEGEPEKYPCKVESEQRANSADTYFHTFFYMGQKTCEKCGHKTMEWEIEGDKE